jgi:hypothetical protein
MLPRPVRTDGAFATRAISTDVRAGRPVGRLSCGPPRPRVGAHVELFVDGAVLLVPGGIGIAEPFVGSEPFVAGGRCEYAAVTRDPTGVVEVDPVAAVTLGDLFDLWGVHLGRDGFAGFAGRVAAFVDGDPVAGDPRAIPLARHAQVVLEIGAPFVAPHRRYGFPPGL